MYNRYADIDKFVTDPDKLQITNSSEVYISKEHDYDIVVDLQGHTEDFEDLKPFLVLVARSICELDNIAQKFESHHSWNGRSCQFHYRIAVVFIDAPYVILEYWGTRENTEFDVVFELKNNKFVLKSFGTVQNIPENWDEPLQTNAANGKCGSKKSLFHRLIAWL